MQRINVRRKKLYELVWSKPRTTIAKELGISDVRVGKLCRDMNVPAPPHGYWANKESKRKRRRFEKPPLTYTVAERIQADHEAFSATRPSFNPKNFDEPIPPAPVIPYSYDEAIARYRTLVNQTSIPHATRGTHPVTQKFMAEDESLAKLARTSSWYQFKFTSVEGKQLLEGINRILWFFQDLGFAPHARGQRYIVMWLGGAHGSNFEVAAIQSDSGIRRRKANGPPARFGFWYGVAQWERASAKPLITFSQFTRNALRSIALLIAERTEKGFREWVQRDYESDVAARHQALEEAEAVRERERQKRIAKEKALRKTRSDLLTEALDGSARSLQIRRLVEALGLRMGNVSSPEFRRWQHWALAEAEALDPATRPVDRLNAWFQRFRLDDQPS